MDILMIFWNGVWQNAMRAQYHAPETHTIDEWAAYARSLKRRNPSENLIRMPKV